MKPWMHARTMRTYVCMRAFYFASIRREWTGNGPGLNAPGIGLKAFYVVAAAP